MSYDFKPGLTYGFKVYPSAIIGDVFDTVVALSVLVPEVALDSGYSIAELHAQVYPMLPSGTPDDPMQYNYLLVKLLNGSKTIVGMPWIKEDTITVIGTLVATAKIYGISANDVPAINNALSMNGFKTIKISVGPT